jgi:hypothetical protein
MHDLSDHKQRAIRSTLATPASSGLNSTLGTSDGSAMFRPNELVDLLYHPGREHRTGQRLFRGEGSFLFVVCRCFSLIRRRLVHNTI